MSTEKIRALNDAFRTTMTGGKVLHDRRRQCAALGRKAMVIRRVATFSEFNKENDPHGEHDFGNFDARGAEVLLEDRLLRREDGVRLGRPGRSVKNNPRADNHARGRVLIDPLPRRARGFCFGIRIPISRTFPL